MAATYGLVVLSTTNVQPKFKSGVMHLKNNRLAETIANEIVKLGSV